MTPQEGLVLTTAAFLAAAVFVKGRDGTLGPGVSLVLLILVMLATAAALLHMLFRVTI